MSRRHTIHIPVDPISCLPRGHPLTHLSSPFSGVLAVFPRVGFDGQSQCRCNIGTRLPIVVGPRGHAIMDQPNSRLAGDWISKLCTILSPRPSHFHHGVVMHQLQGYECRRWRSRLVSAARFPCRGVRRALVPSSLGQCTGISPSRAPLERKGCSVFMCQMADSSKASVGLSRRYTPILIGVSDIWPFLASTSSDGGRSGSPPTDSRGNGPEISTNRRLQSIYLDIARSLCSPLPGRDS